MKEYFTVGQIINTHGVKGELKIYPLTDDIRRFRKLSKIYIDNQEKHILWCKLQSDRVILKIEGVDTIEEALSLKNKYIDVSKEDAVKLPEGSYFIAEIIDCNVYDENGTELGKIYDVIKTGSNDVYWIKGSEDLMIPALKSIVVKIDVENKKVIVKPLETWI